MGNMICCCRRRRRRNILPTTETIPATPYLNPNPNYFYQSPYHCPPQPGTSPSPSPPPYDNHHLHQYPPQINQQPRSLFPGGRYPMMPSLPYVESQKAVTIRNEVNVKKETLRFEPDPENPNRLLVSFTFGKGVKVSDYSASNLQTTCREAFGDYDRR